MSGLARAHQQRYFFMFGISIFITLVATVVALIEPTRTHAAASEGGMWAKVSSNETGLGGLGSYVQLGVANSDNYPSARRNAMYWLDHEGNLWLFGGRAYGLSYQYDSPANDFWKFDGQYWTWISGTNQTYHGYEGYGDLAPGVYGTKGIADTGNMPGARHGGTTWIDSEGNLWLFGGNGWDSQGGSGKLNDLWKFDGLNWTWVHGSDIVNQPGIYGQLRVPSSHNTPGARAGATGWVDAAGRFWLFGGSGLDAEGNGAILNDLWVFDGYAWTWMGGSNVEPDRGSYGMIGVPSSANYPPPRMYAMHWIDKDGNLWMFGGLSCHEAEGGRIVPINDLWKFDGLYWTWIGGSRDCNALSVYGMLQTPSPDAIPGARAGSAAWIDQYGNLWLFGGDGFHDYHRWGLHDLWRFDGQQWAWIGGVQMAQPGLLATQPPNIPWPDRRFYSVAWTDNDGRFWLFGGSGDTGYYYNDLWMFQPPSPLSVAPTATPTSTSDEVVHAPAPLLPSPPVFESPIPTAGVITPQTEESDKMQTPTASSSNRDAVLPIWAVFLIVAVAGLGIGGILLYSRNSQQK